MQSRDWSPPHTMCGMYSRDEIKMVDCRGKTWVAGQTDLLHSKAQGLTPFLFLCLPTRERNGLLMFWLSAIARRLTGQRFQEHELGKNESRDVSIGWGKGKNVDVLAKSWVLRTCHISFTFEDERCKYSTKLLISEERCKVNLTLSNEMWKEKLISMIWASTRGSEPMTSRTPGGRSINRATRNYWAQSHITKFICDKRPTYC